MIKLEPRRCDLAVRCFLDIIASSVYAKKGRRLRRRWDSNPRIKVLQTSALPLGYVA